MGVKIDLTNQRFGRLVVLKEGGRDSSNKILWVCKCDCGTIKEIRGSDLRSGKTTSCGCYNKEKRSEGYQQYIKSKKESPGYQKDLSGMRFGKLTVLEFNQEKTCESRKIHHNYSTWWKCKCDCGNIVDRTTTALTSGKTQSCGCLTKEKLRKLMKEKVQPLGAQTRLIDLTNQRFGNLLVLERYAENSKSNKPRWVCRCDCGNIKIVDGNSLKQGMVKSCGCIGNSLGEDKIRKILSESHIPFKQQIKFEDLKDQTYLRFDFGIYDENDNLIKLIEYDGRQHTDQTSIWHTETALKHDQMKTQYCIDKHIKLQRISYLDYDKIDLAYLLS